MAKTVPTGTTFQYASNYGTSVNITQITNATTAVATVSAGHGVAVGDYVEIVNSGWSRLIGRVFRVSAVATNDLTLEGLNTSDTTRYPGGATAAAGSLRRITWADIPQVARDGSSITPGEPRFADASDLADDFDVQIPVGRDADQVQIVVHYDPALTAFSTLRSFAETQALRAYRMNHPAGDKTVFTAYIAVPVLPSLQPGQTRRLQMQLRLRAEATTYAT